MPPGPPYPSPPVLHRASSLKRPKDEALEIASLGKAEQDWMVHARAAPFHDLQTPLRVRRRRFQDLFEQRFSDVVGAASAEQEPAGDEQLHRSEVDLLIPAQGSLDVSLLASERRWIEDHGVKLPPVFHRISQKVEGVRQDHFDILEAVELGICLQKGNRVLGDLDRRHFGRSSRQLKRKATGEGKTVERLAESARRAAQTIVLLIEEAPRLLALAQIGAQSQRSFAVFDEGWDLPSQHFLHRSQSLKRAHARVGPVHQAPGAPRFYQQVCQELLAIFGALHQKLRAQVVAVPVDD